MSKRKNKKKFKQGLRNKVMLGVGVTNCDECKQDSIAHKIKSYFKLDTITNRMLFKYDKETRKLLVSKKHLIYLLSLCNDIETLRDYDMEIVDKIDILSR